MNRAAIRQATARDLDAIAACARAAYAKYVPRIGREPAPMVADFEALVKAGEVHVLAEGKSPVGFIVMRPAPDHFFVENVAIHPDRQCRGLGYRLMRFAEDEARRHGLPALRLYTNAKMTENIAFYETLGFIETRRRRESGFDRVYFGKHLD